jgi:hypothetical protein
MSTTLPLSEMTAAERAAEADRANTILAVEQTIDHLKGELKAMGRRCYNSEAHEYRDQVRAGVIRETELPAAFERLRALKAGIGTGLRP